MQQFSLLFHCFHYHKLQKFLYSSTNVHSFTFFGILFKLINQFFILSIYQTHGYFRKFVKFSSMIILQSYHCTEFQFRPHKSAMHFSLAFNPFQALFIVLIPDTVFLIKFFMDFKQFVLSLLIGISASYFKHCL